MGSGPENLRRRRSRELWAIPAKLILPLASLGDRCDRGVAEVSLASLWKDLITSWRLGPFKRLLPANPCRNDRQTPVPVCREASVCLASWRDSGPGNGRKPSSAATDDIIDMTVRHRFISGNALSGMSAQADDPHGHRPSDSGGPACIRCCRITLDSAGTGTVLYR